jgi:TatD DNase family protein
VRLVDSHAHLYFEHFDADRDEVLAAARRVGVAAFVDVGTDAETTRLCFETAAVEADVFPTAGIHPNHAHEADEAEWAEIESYIADSRCVGVGETGLDWFRNASKRTEQIAAFERQIAAAKARDLPIVVHCREAFADVYDVLEHVGKGVRGVMHCFSGGPDEARRALDLGLDLSFAAPITYKKNDALRAAAALAPLDRVLIETDCPFLPPEGRRGKRNEPSFLPATLASLAEAKGISPEEAAHASTANAIRLFRLPI